MGKVRTRILGLEELEKQQIEDQRKRSSEKKAQKSGDAEVEAESTAKRTSKEKESVTRQPRKRGKNWQAAVKKVDAEKMYSVKEAVEVLKKIKFAKFDESVELHMNLDKKGLKGEVSLPHSSGKSVRARIVDDALLEEIENGKMDFDVLVAHPSMMPKLAKFARTLGPKGLMPNPKSGTVSPNPEEVVKKFEGGSLQWKSESKFPILHQMVAKMSADNAQIEENVVAFMKAVGKQHILAAYIKSSMSPSLQLDMKELQ
jgi:large subunit ribosomal protein L1